MIEKTFQVRQGLIHYWTNDFAEGRQTLVFLPGLTADNRLFKHQIEFFREDYNLLVWDAPGHNASRPFVMDFSLKEKTLWLGEILEKEKIESPVLIGQSMGGYVSQCFMELYPGRAGGFISIDSAPIKRKYMTGAEIWLLKHTRLLYRMYPWNALVKAGSKGCSTTDYGQSLMREMMNTYPKEEYCILVSHGYTILGEAIEANLPYTIDCPALLICGERDMAGSTKRYNRKWVKTEKLPIHWIKDAGHNSNTDKPDEINEIISEFVKALPTA